MRKRTTIAICGLAGLIGAATTRPAARAADQQPPARPQGAQSSATVDPQATPAKGSGDGVKSIALPQLPDPLPDLPGKNLVTANCILCHSTSYIMMQPAFPRKVWEAEVEKMRKTFGAPVPEQSVPQIVDYLMAVRGTEPSATRPAK